MRFLPLKRLAQLALVLVLAAGQSAGIVSAGPAPAHLNGIAAFQSDPGFLPGFGEPSSDVTVVSSAIGNLDPLMAEPATLTIERLRIFPGDEVPPVDGPQILEIEHGSLSYTDDLGLDAELQADASAFFAAGNATPIVNEGTVPAVVLRTTISSEPVTDEGDTDSESDTSEDGNPNATGERPTPAPTEDGASGNSDAITLAREISPGSKMITAATPSASPVAATPEASPTPEPTAAPASTAKLGVLLQAELTDLPASEQQLFAAELELQPGAELELTGSSGPVGIIAVGGDLTVEREGHTSSKLRAGRSVLLPTGTVATLVNEGDTPLSLQVAGIGGTTAVGDLSDEPTTTTPDDTPTLDDGPIDMTGPHRFVPSEAEMEHLGLFIMPDLVQESSETTDNVLWFTDAGEATDKLTEYDWQNFLLEIYSGDGEATDYGEITSLALNVDTFGNSNGASGFYDYIRDEIFQGGASHSRDISQLAGVDAEMRASFYNSDDKLDYGFMVIRSGEYVVSLYLRGTDLNTIGLMEAVATLIFGPRG